MGAPQTLTQIADGPIQAADGMSIPEFVRKAFNDN
jgi:hypothetical protein